MVLSALFDPQVLFIAFCLACPVFTLDTTQARITFLTHWFNIAAIIIAFLFTFYVAKTAENKKTVPLTSTESRQATWWLLNGIFIHFVMDGCTLISNQLPKILTKFNINFKFPEYYLHTMYGQMDTRYFGHPTVDTVTVIELFIMFPLCLGMYYAVKTHASWRAPLQLITAVFQLFGTFIYVGTEFFESPILKHFNHVDYNLEFTQQHIILFWFAFSANIIWIIIPTWFIYDAYVELSAIVDLNVGNVITVGPKAFVFSPQAFEKNRPTPRFPTSPAPLPTDSKYEIHIVPRESTDSPFSRLSPLPTATVHHNILDFDQPVFDLTDVDDEPQPIKRSNRQSNRTARTTTTTSTTSPRKTTQSPARRGGRSKTTKVEVIEEEKSKSPIKKPTRSTSRRTRA